MQNLKMNKPAPTQGHSISEKNVSMIFMICAEHPYAGEQTETSVLSFHEGHTLNNGVLSV